MHTGQFQKKKKKKVMKSLNQNITLLRGLAYLPTHQKRVLFKKLTNQQIHAIAEIAANFLAKVFRISEKIKSELSGKKGVIRRIASREVTDKKRHEIIKKNSALVSLLIKAAIEKLVGNV